MTGSIIRSDNSGLGTLAREFWDNGIIDRALIYPNGAYKTFNERFPGSREVVGSITKEDIDWLLTGVDKLLFFETPFDWGILSEAKRRGIRTIIMPMHEGLQDPPPGQPDLWLCPSDLEMSLSINPRKFLPVPVNTKRIKWKQREKAHIFVHNGGHGGIQSRNGTMELIEALKFTKKEFKLIIRSQSYNFVCQDPRVEVRYGNIQDYWDVWGEGDVFIFPEKFNGLSLPIQEAVATGMMVMSTDRRPFNQWLPKQPLIKTDGFTNTMISRKIEVAKISPRHIAEKIDEFVDKDIKWYSEWGRLWAENHSWEKLKNQYLNL